MFALAFIGVGAVMYIIHTQVQEFELNNTRMLTRAILHSAYDNNTHTLDQEALKKAGYELITDEELKHDIVKKRRFLPKRVGNNRKFIVKTVAHGGSVYIVIKNSLVFKAPHQPKVIPKILLPILVVLLILFLYVATIRSILPLYGLRQKVKEFADGNYDIDCKSEKEDEIGILSNEFDKSVKKIKKLRDSRQLFLRNIMHELKTPITKGKLSCAMLEDSTYLTTLKNVFKRQEVLLNEFSRIEKLSANEVALKKENYSLEDIVDYALDILSHEKESVTCKLEPMNLHVDFELFGTAIKNLLDNGINYSDDTHVKIQSTNDDKIIISNSGNELEFPLQRYSEPYFLEGKKQKSSRGLGFGLFITTNIINLHNAKIEYNRQNNRNVFIIDVKKIRKK
jgi:two-component system OmpR family sensor kinase